MKKKRVLTMIAAMAMTAVVCVGGTLAFLSAQSEMVNNTFTVGTGYEDDGPTHGIKLDEAKVNADGTVSESERVSGDQTYPELMPDCTRVKDPTVYFVSGSVESYVFVKVEGVTEAAENHIVVQDWNSDWVKLNVDGTVADDQTTFGDGYYVFNGANTENYVLDLTEEQDPKTVELGEVFGTIYVEDMTNEEFTALGETFNDSYIKVSACAVQAAEDATMQEAFDQATFR